MICFLSFAGALCVCLHRSAINACNIHYVHIQRYLFCMHRVLASYQVGPIIYHCQALSILLQMWESAAKLVIAFCSVGVKQGTVVSL